MTKNTRLGRKNKGQEEIEGFSSFLCTFSIIYSQSTCE